MNLMYSYISNNFFSPKIGFGTRNFLCIWCLLVTLSVLKLFWCCFYVSIALPIFLINNIIIIKRINSWIFELIIYFCKQISDLESIINSFTYHFIHNTENSLHNLKYFHILQTLIIFTLNSLNRNLIPLAYVVFPFPWTTSHHLIGI